MRKKGKLFTVIFTFLFLLLSAAGCGKEFDASGYLKAVLDNSYKHDPTAFLEQKIGSEEEAEQLFQEGIDANIAALTESASVSQEQEQNFRAIFEQIYAQADYTVGEAQKQEDDSYVVTVTLPAHDAFCRYPAPAGGTDGAADKLLYGADCGRRRSS